MELNTSRLTLIAADKELIEAALASRAALGAALGADIPAEWPPPLNDDAALRYVQNAFKPQDHGWWFWYLLLQRSAMPQLAIGIAGFKGPPKHGVVEIGYSVVTEHQRNGFATQACAALMEWAVSTGRVSRVIAHTLVGLTPSIRVLEKLGFAFEGESQDEQGPPGETVIRYGLAIRRNLTDNEND